MEDCKNYSKVVEFLTTKSEKLIEQYPHLKELQAEVDRLLSSAPDEKTRQEILDIMFHVRSDDLHTQLHHLKGLLDSMVHRL